MGCTRAGEIEPVVTENLHKLTPGMPVLFGGDRLVRVPDDLAARFRPGDRLIVTQRTGDLLHIPAEVHLTAVEAVERAHEAFQAMASVPDERISRFYDEFARRLESDEIWAPIGMANAGDVERARERGRSVTRLIA